MPLLGALMLIIQMLTSLILITAIIATLYGIKEVKGEIKKRQQEIDNMRLSLDRVQQNKVN